MGRVAARARQRLHRRVTHGRTRLVGPRLMHVRPHRGVVQLDALYGTRAQTVSEDGGAAWWHAYVLGFDLHAR